MFPSLGIITNGIVIIPFVAAAPYCMCFCHPPLEGEDFVVIVGPSTTYQCSIGVVFYVGISIRKTSVLLHSQHFFEDHESTTPDLNSRRCRRLRRRRIAPSLRRGVRPPALLRRIVVVVPPPPPRSRPPRRSHDVVAVAPLLLRRRRRRRRRLLLLLPRGGLLRRIRPRHERRAHVHRREEEEEDNGEWGRG